MPAELLGELGGLPLALRQARAYCLTRHLDYEDYLKLLRTRRADIFSKNAIGSSARTLASVLATSRDQVSQESALAETILNTCAYLPPRGTPRDLLMEPFARSEPLLAFGDKFEVLEALAVLAGLSLITVEAVGDRADVTLSIHRVVASLSETLGGSSTSSRPGCCGHAVRDGRTTSTRPAT